jgi:carbon storage regulator
MSDSEYGYLCLTRRPDQMIRIGDNIRLKVISVDGYNVRIGIRAPKDIVILREEVYQRDLDARTEEEEVCHDKVDSAYGSVLNLINEIFGMDKIEEGK